MSLILCVKREAQAGRLSKQDHERLTYLYNAVFRDELARLGGAAGTAALAQRAADDAFDTMLKQMAWERTRAAQLQKEAEDRILVDAARHPNDKGEADVGDYALKLIDHIYFNQMAMTSIDMAELSQLAHEFRRTARSGRRRGKTRARNLLYEMFGENTGDAAAKGYAAAWAELIRRKVEQYNGAGGAIAFRDDWIIPQRHDAIAVGRAGPVKWRQVILAETDMARAFNKKTGRPFTPVEYDEAIQDSLETILWHGVGGDVAESSSAPFWRRRNDPRFFVFNNAAAWERYHKQFGDGKHIFEVMVGYIRSINHDIAAMQGLGPDPESTITWLAGPHGKEDGLIMQAGRDAEFGRPALFPTRDDIGVPFGDRAGTRLQYAKNKAMGVRGAWRYLTGEARRPAHDGWAMVEGTVSNVMYANLLGSTPFLGGGDIINQAATRAFNSLSKGKMMRDMWTALRLSGNKQELVELMVEVDTGLSAINIEAREMAVLHGHPVSQWITDREMTFSGLKPMTMGFRGTWVMGALHELTRQQAIPYPDLPPNFRNMLERYNIDEPAWAYVQATPLRPSTKTYGKYPVPRVIRPQDIAHVSLLNGLSDARPGFSSGMDVATRIVSMIKEEGEYAVISGTPRSARILPYRPGTILGTFGGSMSKLKTYSISHMQHHGNRAAAVFWREGAGLRGTAAGARYYVLGLLLPSMFLVAVGTTANEIVHGRNPPDWTDWKFWDRIFWRSISLGFFQDVFQGALDPDAVFQGKTKLLGPTVDLLATTLALGNTALNEAGAAIGMHEDDTRLGRQAIKTARKWVPRTWGTDLAVDRLVWDNFQRAVDPEADEDFARQAARVEQGMWAPPGGPIGSPDLSTLDLTNKDQDPGFWNSDSR